MPSVEEQFTSLFGENGKSLEDAAKEVVAQSAGEVKVVEPKSKFICLACGVVVDQPTMFNHRGPSMFMPVCPAYMLTRLTCEPTDDKEYPTFNVGFSDQRKKAEDDGEEEETPTAE